MIIDVSDLGDEGLRFDKSLRLDDVMDSDQEPLDVDAVRLAGTALPSARGAHLSGRLEATLSLECSRCVERFSSPVEGEFRLVVVRETPRLPEGELELDDDDLDLFEAADGKVDLKLVAREQIYLNLPLKPVCRPDCRGLCPTCGGNRNRIECGCSREEPDPRLAPLLELKKRMGGD